MVLLLRMYEDFGDKRKSGMLYEHSHWRKTIFMQIMLKTFYTTLLIGGSRVDIQWKKIIFL